MTGNVGKLPDNKQEIHLLSLLKTGLLYISSYTHNPPSAETLKWRPSFGRSLKFPSALACNVIGL